MSAAQREAKFAGLAGKVLAADAVRAVIDRVARLDALSASDLTHLLHPGADPVAVRVASA